MCIRDRPTQILAAYQQDNPNKSRNYLQILEASILKKKEVCDDEKKLAYTARFRRISNKQKKILASLSGMSVTAGTSVPIKQKKKYSKPMPAANTQAGIRLRDTLRAMRLSRKKRGIYAVNEIENKTGEALQYKLGNDTKQTHLKLYLSLIHISEPTRPY